MSIKKLSKSRTKSRTKSKTKSRTKSRTSSKSKPIRSAQYMRVFTNKNGNVKYDYMTKDEAQKHMRQRHKRMDRYRPKKTKKMAKQKGGFNDSCKLATVKEKGFNFAGMGDIAGLNIPDKRGIIFRPDCGNNSYNAMMP